jgi:hypothetical protein
MAAVFQTVNTLLKEFLVCPLLAASGKEAFRRREPCIMRGLVRSVNSFLQEFLLRPTAIAALHEGHPAGGSAILMGFAKTSTLAVQRSFGHRHNYCPSFLNLCLVISMKAANPCALAFPSFMGLPLS